MKTNILYQTNHGTTEKMVQYLAEKIEGEVKIFRIDQSQLNDMLDAQNIVIGGSIHAGKIQKSIRKFCNNNLDKLMGKNIGLFICCMLKAQEEEEFYNAFPEKLIKHSKVQGKFGGEILFDKMNFFERFLTRKVAKINESQSKISYDAIEEFISGWHK
ncbi:MAG: flavodoxin domain-containing protein [Bacteroidales bacterium]